MTRISFQQNQFPISLSIGSPLCITLNNSLLFRLSLWQSWVIENSINLVLSLLKTKLLIEGHSDTVSRSDSNSLIQLFSFSILNEFWFWSWRVKGLKRYPVAFKACTEKFNLWHFSNNVGWLIVSNALE